jgi:hypothetical protein
MFHRPPGLMPLSTTAIKGGTLHIECIDLDQRDGILKKLRHALRWRNVFPPMLSPRGRCGDKCHVKKQ